MDQEKIGKFILELRKEKNMTQLELANKIGVSDRTISKWENGRGLPDLSLMRPLCKELGITINELISGEIIHEKEYQEKLEENILNTIDYTDKKINKIKKIFIIILSIIFMFFVMYFIDIYRMKNNKNVIFSTWGYEYTPPIDIKEDEIESAIIDYLVEKGNNELKNYQNEKTFVSMKIYLLEEKEKNKYYNVYAWVLSNNYYLDDDKIKESSGSSIPYKFVVKNIDGKFIVMDSIVPRDGSYYSVDMKNIFPSNVRENMENVYYDGTIEKLELDIEKQIKLYFHR